MRNIGNTWSLMGESWRILKKDKEMLWFPFFSGISCLLVLASFAIPIFAADAWRPPAREAETARQVVYYGTIFLFYFCNYFVITFFNTALVACAAIRMGGGNPAVGDGFKAAFGRIHLICGWALISATIGMILNAIENQSERAGSFVAGLLGSAWTLISFLVIPVMVLENQGPFAALKESTRLLKRTWGQQLVGNFSFGLIFFLLCLPAFGLMAIGVWMETQSIMQRGWAMGGASVLGILYLVILSLVQSAIQAIFQTAIFVYARDGAAPAGFSENRLSGAISPR